ncbi:UNKNOWN [Stylonychia lemnae]|uniref:Uncharacterized protein n=1 Tax=Stylonychia lemnae TaxID=5949 RepID=A0A077ZST7_STYLE|nr:UNKNOWN [Stylonychia lemnae]|eukprot:CDW72948.1 UNKNOWN [Stylonychia lemnae]
MNLQQQLIRLKLRNFFTQQNIRYFVQGPHRQIWPFDSHKVHDKEKLKEIKRLELVAQQHLAEDKTRDWKGHHQFECQGFIREDNVDGDNYREEKQGVSGQQQELLNEAENIVKPGENLAQSIDRQEKFNNNLQQESQQLYPGDSENTKSFAQQKSEQSSNIDFQNQKSQDQQRQSKFNQERGERDMESINRNQDKKQKQNLNAKQFQNQEQTQKQDLDKNQGVQRGLEGHPESEVKTMEGLKDKKQKNTQSQSKKDWNERQVNDPKSAGDFPSK